MFVAGAQCMCDRSYEEDDAEDDEAEDTGCGQHRTRDLLKYSLRVSVRSRTRLDRSYDNSNIEISRRFSVNAPEVRKEGRNAPFLTRFSNKFVERFHSRNETRTLNRRRSYQREL